MFESWTLEFSYINWLFLYCSFTTSLVHMVNIGSQEREQIASEVKKDAINTSVTAINCCKLWQMPEAEKKTQQKNGKILTGVFSQEPE